MRPARGSVNAVRVEKKVRQSCRRVQRCSAAASLRAALRPPLVPRAMQCQHVTGRTGARGWAHWMETLMLFRSAPSVRGPVGTCKDGDTITGRLLPAQSACSSSKLGAIVERTADSSWHTTAWPGVTPATREPGPRLAHAGPHLRITSCQYWMPAPTFPQLPRARPPPSAGHPG